MELLAFFKRADYLPTVIPAKAGIHPPTSIASAYYEYRIAVSHPALIHYHYLVKLFIIGAENATVERTKAAA